MSSVTRPDAATGTDPAVVAWLRLAHTNGIGPVRGQALLRRFGSPEAVLAAPLEDVSTVLGSTRLAAALLGPDAARDTLTGAARSWAGGAADRALIVLGDPRYPPRLLDLPDPPLLLYCRGDWRQLAAPQIAIVGSRNATALGQRTAADLAGALVADGVTVTSGLAEGIDRAAHLGALGAGGPTIAVVGTGIDRAYPSRHRPLAERIAANGALVGEHPPGMGPLAGNFPRRNRLIAAMSSAVVVVEAALRSGSLITARLAADLGREVLAVPGSIHSPLARGCHSLLRQGAGLVESAGDILDALPSRTPNRVRSPSELPVSLTSDAAAPTGEQARLLASMSADPVRIETLADHHGWPLMTALAAVQRLELDGWVRRQADGRYVRSP